MGNTAKYILGGLLQGVGEGAILQGKAQREAMREKLRQEHDIMMEGMRHENTLGEIGLRGELDEKSDVRQHGFRMEETTVDNDRDDARQASDHAFRASESEKDRAADKAKRGLLPRERFTANGKVWVQNEDGSAVPVNGPDGKQLEDLSGDDVELVEVADPDKPGQTKMVPKSQASGMPGKSSTDAMVQERSDRELAAEEQAIAEAEKQGGAAGPWDDSDFPKDGSREAFIERRKKEILSGKTTDTGGASDNGGGNAAPSGGAPAGQEQKPGGGAPKGTGTQQDPYQAVSQADVEWFKKNAPAGAVLAVKGKDGKTKLYQK